MLSAARWGSRPRVAIYPQRSADAGQAVDQCWNSGAKQRASGHHDVAVGLTSENEAVHHRAAGERAGDGRLGVASDLLAQLVRSGSDRRQLHRNKTEVDARAFRPGFPGRRLRHEHDTIREMVERQRGNRAGDKADADSHEGLPTKRPRDALTPTRLRRGLGRLELVNNGHAPRPYRGAKPASANWFS